MPSSPFILQPKVPFVEDLNLNGETQQRLYVVKNTPFVITVAFSRQDSHASLQTAKVTADLLLEKDKSVVKSILAEEPLVYESRVDNEGKNLVLSFRLQFLSSKVHSLFLIRLRLDIDGQEQILLTSPIKCVSKQATIRRRKEEVSNPGQTKTPKKRARGDDIFEALNEIKQKQEEQLRLLRTLQKSGEKMEKGFSSPSSALDPLFPSLPLPSDSQPQVHQNRETSTKKRKFEDAFCDFLSAYQALSEEERSSKLRRLVPSSSNPSLAARVVSCLAEAVSPPNSPTHSSGQCHCDDCPWRRELQAMEASYEDFLGQGTNPPSGVDDVDLGHIFEEQAAGASLVL